MSKPALWTKDFIFVSVSNFFVFLTFYYLLVTLPIYTIEDLQGGGTEAGLIVTVFLISAIISRPLTGNWISRYGTKVIFIISLTLFFLGAALYFFPSTIGSLLVLRFFHGIGFGMVTTATGTIVANIIPDSRRGEGMGYYALFMNLAMVMGPFLGLTAMQNWGIEVTFTLTTLCAFIALGIGVLVQLPKAKEDASLAPKREKMSFRFGDMFEASAVKISLVGAFFAITYSSILSFVSVYANDNGLAEVSSFFFVVYAAVLLLSRPFTGKWYDRFGANVIIYPALVIFAVGMFILSGAHTALLFLLAAGFIGLGWGTVFPSFQTIAIQEAPPAKRGVATATFLSIFDVGIGFGSFIVGVIGGQIGFSSLYFYGSFFILAGILLYYFLHGSNHQVPATTQNLSNNS
ncbi:MFS transporter [Bacillus carboniphilus]|uniref:MFS transporter n=1 Tax=Bacillus carboniphilus TaxID=86663 RepID=A0ABP3FWK2_9BACI